jgi:hypothetical protein
VGPYLLQISQPSPTITTQQSTILDEGVVVAFDGIASIGRRLAGLLVGIRHGLPVFDQDLVSLAIF